MQALLDVRFPLSQVDIDLWVCHVDGVEKRI